MAKSRAKTGERSVSNPQISEPNTRLESLVHIALRRYGTFDPGTVDGNVMLMLLDFANQVVEDVRNHVYWTGEKLDYYVHMSDARPIPDEIVTSGVLFYYAVQQQSNKVTMYGPAYYRRMNQILYNRRYGNQTIELQAVDRDATAQAKIDLDKKKGV